MALTERTGDPGAAPDGGDHDGRGAQARPPSAPSPILLTPAPVVVARAAALPAAAVRSLRLPEALRLTRRAANLTAQAGAVAAHLGPLLFAMVPTTTDRTARAALVRLQRGLHQGRTTSRTDTDLALARTVLAPPVKADLERWARLHAEAAADRALAQRRTDNGLAEAQRQLALRLVTSPVAPALAFASPPFARTVAGLARATLGSHLAPASRLGRTATAYVTRAALKSSPFSSLALLDAHRLEGTAASFPAASGTARPAPGRRHVTVDRTLGVQLLMACARDPELAGAFSYVWHEGAAPEHVDAAVPLTSYVPDGAGRWQQYVEAADITAYRSLTGAGPDALRTGTLGERALFRRLLSAGLIRPVAPWYAGDGGFLRALATALDRLGGPRARGVASLARQTERTAAAAADADAEGTARADALAQARAAADACLDLAGRRSGARTDGTPVAFESVAAHRTDPPPPDALRALAALGVQLAAHTIVDPRYRTLVDGFTARYGTGGTCRDVAAFLSRFAEGTAPRGPSDVRALHAAWAAAPVATAEQLSGTGTVLPAMFSVGFQPTGARIARDGGPCIVVDQLTPGGLGSLLRWSGVLPDADLPGAVGRWLRESRPGHTVCQFSSHTDLTQWQQPHPGVLPVLETPWDLPTAHRAEHPAPLRLRDLTLRHHPATATLQLQLADGTPVAAAYTGATPVQALSQHVQALGLLSSPWLCRLWLDPALRTLVEPRPDAVIAVPRRARGPVVLERARWRVPAALVPVPERHESYPVYLGRLDLWRRDHGIPDEVYVRLTSSTSPEGVGKPRWLAFDAPHAVYAFAATLTGQAAAGVAEFTEALPGWGTTGSQPHTDEGAAHRTEYVAVLRAGAPADGWNC